MMENDKNSVRSAVIEARSRRCLESVTHQLFDESWGPRDYDFRLWNAYQIVLEYVHASAMVLIDTRSGERLPIIGHRPLKGRRSGPRPLSSVIGSVVDFALELSSSIDSEHDAHRVAVIQCDNEMCDFAVVWRAKQRNVGIGFVCAFYPSRGFRQVFGEASDVADDLLLANREADLHRFRFFAKVWMSMAWDGLSHYRDRYAAFSPAIREHYWGFIRDRKRPGVDRQSGRMPPWDICERTERTVKTVSLSLDLRKSTYCMQYASSSRDFGQWLRTFTEKMRSVTHRHGGIYDKFTGDGCLVHFLEAECQATLQHGAMEAAVHCAVDMQRVVEKHMELLREFLQHDSEIFGAGIAIDVGEAHWAVEEDRGNPVVTGAGVVGACRVGDKAPRGMIRLTNVAYFSLEPKFREKLRGAKKVQFETKESAGGFPLLCWQFAAARADGLGLGYDEIERLCDEVYKRLHGGRKEREGGNNRG